MSIAQPYHVFVGNSIDEHLAMAVCQMLSIERGRASVKAFNDGEVNVKIDDSVRHCHVYVIHSTCSTEQDSVNDSVMQLILMLDALKRSSAKSVTAIIPYYGYGRQDRKVQGRVPISASVVAKMIQSAGADRIVSIDLHCGQIQGFFDVPTDNLYASVAFVPVVAMLCGHSSNMNGRSLRFMTSPVTQLPKKPRLSPLNPPGISASSSADAPARSKLTIVSPDAGGVARCAQFIKGLTSIGIKANLAMIIKQRSKPGEVATMNVVGSSMVQDACCVIVDDIADTCGTLIKAAEQLKVSGASSVYACVTHAVFSNNAVARIEESGAIEQLYVTDTIPQRKQSNRVTVISIAPLIASVIQRTITGQSVSALFEHDIMV